MRDIQVRANGKLNINDEATDNKVISGYFVVVNSETELFDGVHEVVSPDALQNLDMSDVRALIDHDTAKVLGRTKSNTLTLTVDEKGLYGEIIVNENDQEALNLYSRVQRGDVDQCSFGFEVLDETSERRADGSMLFTIKEIKLHEVSVVTFPAYEDTSVEARSKQIKKGIIQNKKKELRGRLHGT